MAKTFSISTPPEFSFDRTVRSHGWYDLRPFEFLPEKGVLVYVFRDRDSGRAITGMVRSGRGKLLVELGENVDTKEIKRDIRHILRLDENFADFYQITSKGNIKWPAVHNAGRLLRSSTVFEDLVKSLCTTNCSWGLTKVMTTNLVNLLGEKATDGRRAFPTPTAMGEVGAEFYRSEIKAGYRSAYFAELADAVASGNVDPEAWLHAELPTADLKKEIKKIKGIGDYAAENLLKLLGRYDGLALDSWLRSGYYRKHNRGKKCSDKKIQAHYRKYGEWQGLAIWCDMTEDWFSEGVSNTE